MSALLEISDCASTQDEVSTRLEDPSLKFVAVRANTQSAGQGRQGRSWKSPKGNLYLSLGFRVGSAAERPWPFVSLLAGLAVARSLNDLGAWDTHCFLKWPNDIYRSGPEGFQKIGGILTELRKGKLIVGIGLNIKTAPALGPEAIYTSIALQDFAPNAPSASEFARRLVPTLQILVEEWIQNPTAVSASSISELESGWMRPFFK